MRAEDMGNGKRERRGKCLEWLPAVCMSLFLLGFVWTVLGNYFETNDDRFIAEILSGAIGGQPEAHVIFVNYLLSWPISILYRLNVGIPWYGLMFLLFQILTYTALFQSAYSRGKTVIEKAVMAVFMGSCVLLNLYITVALEFTSTAAIMAVTGYMCLLLNQNQKRGWMLFCFFETMAFLLRDQAMLMIQPLGLLVCSSEFWREKRKWIKSTGCMIFAIVAIVLVGSLGTWVSYRGERWANFNRYDQARAELFDYYGNPEYGEVEGTLEKYGVSDTEYAAFREYALLSRNIGAECVEELIEYEKTLHGEKKTVMEVVREIWVMRSDEKYLEVSRVTGIVCCAAFLWFLLQRHITALASLMGLLVSSLSVEGYLIYRGRLPLRVMLPLFSCEIFFMIAIMLRDYTDGKRDVRHCASACLTAALFVLLFTFSGRQQYHVVKGEQEWQKDYIEGLVEVQEYCNVHPEKRFILDIVSFAYYTGGVLETRLAGQQNYVYSGGWMCKSPFMNDYLHSYLGGEEENICLIIHLDGRWEETPMVAFLAEAIGEKPVVMEQLEVSNGEIYMVWGFMDD